ncbi:hypothetical protein [Nannocystis pusilla]|uniref:hypothetical protein n=1 Tax=Nannocystis pusilla TaxID=889268 RepID=UPI003B7DD6C7
MLAFLDLRSGMRVADLGAGFGYTTFLLSRAVGPDGVVYAQNNTYARERFLEPKWTERLTTPAFRNVVRVDREFDDPLPPEAKDLDLVINVLFYHDTFWFGTDRARMNRAVFAALRPGGAYVIVDHSAAAGAAASVAKTLHRVEESTVRAEIEQAGFTLARSAEFLRNPADARDWNAAPSPPQSAAGRRIASCSSSSSPRVDDLSFTCPRGHITRHAKITDRIVKAVESIAALPPASFEPAGITCRTRGSPGGVTRPAAGTAGRPRTKSRPPARPAAPDRAEGGPRLHGSGSASRPPAPTRRTAASVACARRCSGRTRRTADRCCRSSR